MRFLSVCSGIEAASVAWNPIGWHAVAFSEIEKFPSAVLAHHYPDTPNWGDMTKYKEWPDGSIDLLCGGTPCQSFSVAGLRKGLDDPRGDLMLTFLAIAAKYRPRWLVWENVPGVLSTNDGRDFGTFIGGLAELGYGFAWRIIDAQYARAPGFCRAVPQRRRRVFVIGHLGDWRRAAAILFDSKSLSGNPAPRRQAGKVAPTIPARSTGGGGFGTDFDGGLIPSIAGCLAARDAKDPDSDTKPGHLIPIAFPARMSAVNYGFDRSPTLCAESQMAVAIRTAQTGSNGIGIQVNGPAYTLDGAQQAVAFVLRGREGGAMLEGPHETASIRAAGGGSSRSYVAQPMRVRRLTPTECERLMGFPDGYTRVPYRGGPADRCPDGPRLKALGNSWAVNCARWIGRRIQMMEDFDTTVE